MDQPLKRVRLLGAAGRKFGRVFHLAVKSPAEAVRAISALRPGFHGWVLEQHDRGVAWRVITDQPEGIEAEELDRETSQDIILAPVLVGAGGGSFGNIFKIVLGVVLIAASIFIPGSAMIFGTAFGKISLGVGLVGASLVLGGVAGLLTPTPKLNNTGIGNLGGNTGKQGGVENSRSDDLESNLFSRNQGSGGQGECVPLLYGQRRVRAPRVVSFELRNSVDGRDIDVTGTEGLIGYVNRQNLT